MVAPEGSAERIEARMTVEHLTLAALGGGNITAEEWRQKLQETHPALMKLLSDRDVDTVIRWVEWHLSRWQ